MKTLGQAAGQAEARLYQGDAWTIDPRRSCWVPVWDLVMLVAMVFTATVTPYEVAFIDDGPCVTIMFLVNRVVDFCVSPRSLQSTYTLPIVPY